MLPLVGEVKEQQEKIGLYVQPGVNDQGFNAVGSPVRGPADKGGAVGILGGAGVGGSIAARVCRVQEGSRTKLVVPRNEYWHWIRALVSPIREKK
jgi:hypothetical protein